MFQRLPLAFSLVFLIPVSAAAQFGERVEVRVMNVEVEVRDRAGNPVHGLARTDFQVREGRREREITNFTEYRAGTGAALSSSLEDHPVTLSRRPPVQLVIFVDQMRWSRMEHERIGQSLLNLVENELVPGDRVRVVGWNRRVVDLVGWTDDTGRMRAGIATAFGLSLDSALIGTITLDQRTLSAEREIAAETDSEVGSETGQGAGPSSLAALMENAERMVAAKARWRTLTSILDEMAALDGRRAMLIVTTEMGKLNGRTYGSVEEISQLSAGSWDVRDLRENFTRAANASSVKVSFLYPAVLGSGNSAANPSLENDSSAVTSILDSSVLAEVAARTGGDFALRIGMIEQAIPRIAESLSNYYSLGYRSDLGEGEARRISVSVRDRSMKVIVRETVARRSDQEMLEATVVAHAFRPGASQLALSAEVHPATARLGRRAVKLTIRFMVDDITFDVGEREAVAGFVVAAVAVDSETGETGEVVHDTHEISLPIAEYRALQPGQHLTWDAEVRYSKESDTLAVGVKDRVSDLTGLISIPLPGPE